MALEDAPAGIRASHAAGMIPVMVPDLVEPTEEIRKLCYRRVDSLNYVILLEEKLAEEKKVEKKAGLPTRHSARNIKR